MVNIVESADTVRGGEKEGGSIKGRDEGTSERDQRQRQAHATRYARCA